MTDIVSDIIQTTLNSFDFGYCVVVNLLTYFIVKGFEDFKKVLTKWKKRLALLFSIIFIGVIYHMYGDDLKLIVNSAILAPVSWSWIFKPICAKFKLDYKKEVDA